MPSAIWGSEGKWYVQQRGRYCLVYVQVQSCSLGPRLLPLHAIIPHMTFDQKDKRRSKVICGIIACGRRSLGMRLLN